MFPREFEGIQQISLNNNWDLNFGEDEDLVSEVALKRAGIYIMIATISVDVTRRVNPESRENEIFLHNVYREEQSLI